MAESKSNLMDRLRREGRWEEASLFKDATVKQLRAEGMKRAEASEKAWEAVAAKYPPLAPAEPLQADTTQEATEADITALLEREDASPNLVGDIRWAYAHLEDKWTAPADAPGPGAWAMLLWARQYRAPFFEKLLPRAFTDADDSQRREEERNQEWAARQHKEISEMLRQLQLEWDRKLAENVPATVRESVRGLLADWGPRFSLNLPADALESLQAHVGRLAHDCIAAAVADPGAFSNGDRDAATA